MLEGSGATEHSLDDELIPNLKKTMPSCTVVHTPKDKRAAEKQNILAAATGL